MPKSRRRTSKIPRQRQRVPARGTERSEQQPVSRRYTPPLDRQLGFRPAWHRVVGGLLVLLALVVFVLNDFESSLLPGGHTPLYLMAALALVAWSLWWFGAFDRET